MFALSNFHFRLCSAICDSSSFAGQSICLTWIDVGYNSVTRAATFCQTIAKVKSTLGLPQTAAKIPNFRCKNIEEMTSKQFVYLLRKAADILDLFVGL